MSEANNYGRDETKILVRKQKEPLPLFGCFGGLFGLLLLLTRGGLLLPQCSLLKPVSAIWSSYPGERTQPPHLQVIFMLLTEQTKRITGTRLRI